MISERILKKWRREALVDEKITPENTLAFHKVTRVELNERILHTTQELLDLYLVKK